MQFRIIAGSHYQASKTDPKKTVKFTSKDRQGNLPDGISDIIESELDLVKRYGRQKYERIQDQTIIEVAEVPEEVSPVSVEADDFGLNSMTVSQLEAFAEANEIDLSDLSLKSEKLDWIKASLELP